jgi:hypothetical protein
MSLPNIKKITWFGGSWGLGIELEKDSIFGLEIDQQEFIQDHRYTSLVCKHFNTVENNRCIEGTSSECLVKDIVYYVESLDKHQYQNELIVVIWPSNTRYFWIDEYNIEKNLRHDSRAWFKIVDNHWYRDYCMQRSLWSCDNFLRNKQINYVMLNGECQIFEHTHRHYDIDSANWLIPPSSRISDWLNFDINKGYPSIKSQHEYFWPCENHPNKAGHARIANNLIECLTSKIIKKEQHYESSSMEQKRLSIL